MHHHFKIGIAILSIVTLLIILYNTQTFDQTRDYQLIADHNAQSILLTNNTPLPDIEPISHLNRVYFIDSNTCLDAYNNSLRQKMKFDQFDHYICAAQNKNGIFQFITPFDSCKDIYINSEGKQIPYQLDTWPTCNDYKISNTV